MSKAFKLGVTLSSLFLDIFLSPGLYLLYGFLWKTDGTLEDEIVKYRFHGSLFDVAVWTCPMHTCHLMH